MLSLFLREIFDEIGIVGGTNASARIPADSRRETLTRATIVHASDGVMEGIGVSRQGLVEPGVDEAESGLASIQLDVVEVGNDRSGDRGGGGGTSNTLEAASGGNAVRDVEAKDGGNIRVGAARDVPEILRRKGRFRHIQIVGDGRSLVRGLSKGVGEATPRVLAADFQRPDIRLIQIRSTHRSEPGRGSREVGVKLPGMSRAAPDALVTRGEHDGQTLGSGGLQLSVDLKHVSGRGLLNLVIAIRDRVDK